MSIRIIRIAVFLLMLSAIGAGQSEGRQAKDDTSKHQWTEYKFPEQGFAALFPDKPDAANVEPDPEDPSTGYQYMAFGENGAYFIMVREYPEDKTPAATEAFYTKFINGYAEGAHCDVLSRRSAKVAGKQASEAVLQKPSNGITHLIDLFMVGNRLYIIASAGGKGHDTDPNAARFRDSFRILSK